MLLGGGRCTAGGCMCYHAYFDHEGSPISRCWLLTELLKEDFPGCEISPN